MTIISTWINPILIRIYPRKRRWPDLPQNCFSISLSIYCMCICLLFVNVAKCNLGKVKIEPMLVAGCVLWGQQITWCRVFTGVWLVPFAGVAPFCMFANCLILLIIGLGSSRGLYEPLQISCCSCCESLRILADHSRSFSISFCKSLLIHADLQRWSDLSPHASLPFRCFKPFW